MHLIKSINLITQTTSIHPEKCMDFHQTHSVCSLYLPIIYDNENIIPKLGLFCDCIMVDNI